MIHQGRYIISAFLICICLAICVLFFNLFSSLDSSNKDQYINRPIDRVLSEPAIVNAKGKELFIQKCASCHSIFKDMTGPSLAGFTERGPWNDREKIYKWINNPTGFMVDDEYTNSLMKRFGTIMTAFPTLTKEDIDAVIEYISQMSGVDQKIAYK